MPRQTSVLFIIPHIRWQREGLRTFQRARLALVRTLDCLLDDLAHTEEAHFLLDGQAILLEDYLAVRPQQRELVEALLKEGRLDNAAWYVSPDPFLASPEALIRNLLVGRAAGALWSAAPVAAYIPDASGQIGQMPQLLRGFGIEYAVLRDGLGDAPAGLWWEAPDGTRVFTAYLRDGYNNAAGLPPEAGTLLTALKARRDSLAPHCATGVILLMDGDDGYAGRLHETAALAGVGRRLRARVVPNSSLVEAATAAHSRQTEEPVLTGELRSPQRFPIKSGTLSTRIALKQRNRAAEVLLENWAEPFSAWVALLAEQHKSSGPLQNQGELLAHAWRILLHSHTADSLRGTVIDAVAREIAGRFDQVEQIADELTTLNLAHLADLIDTSGVAQGSSVLLPVVVFNGMGHTRTDLVEFKLTLPAGFYPLEAIDDQGRRSPVEVEAVLSPDGVPAPDRAVWLRFVAHDVPPYGYRALALCGARRAEDMIHGATDQGISIENELISLSVNRTDGTVELFDKRTGRSFAGLNRFVDDGDRGDTYTYCPPERNTRIDIATNSPLPVERLVGPVTQQLHVFQILRVPQSLTPDRSARLPFAAQYVPIPVSTNLRITRGIPRVDVQVVIGNSADDHRLTVHFPTGVAAQQAFVDGHFEIVRRESALPSPEQTALWAEQPAPEQPQRAFATLIGSETALTVASRGLPEVAVLSEHEGTEIALTLLRCVGWLCRHDLPNRAVHPAPQVETPEAQCPGEHVFSYSLIPHGIDPLPAWQEAWSFQAPMRCVVTTIHAGPLACSGSLAAVDNPSFVLSAVKMAEDSKGLVVRGYNISHTTERVVLRTGLPFAYAERVLLNESATGEYLKANRQGGYRFDAAPGEIVTIRLWNGQR
jgi:alpha-mannosidase